MWPTGSLLVESGDCLALQVTLLKLGTSVESEASLEKIPRPKENFTKLAAPTGF